MDTASIDWDALEFTCAHEKDLLPNASPEAEEWYRHANGLYKAGDRTGNDELLRKSYLLMRQAAEAGHVKAMNNLVVVYLDGDAFPDGVPTADESKAVEWAKKLIDRNTGLGYYHMGVFLEQGIGVRQDRKAALAYFRRAADLGNPQGQFVVGRKIKAAFAQTPDRDRGYAIATAMLKCALAQGHQEAGYRLGHHYLSEKNIPEALKAFQAAAKLGHRQSLFELSDLFNADADEYGLEKDEARAACYERLWREIIADKTKTFPKLDRICPLPPTPMPRTAG